MSFRGGGLFGRGGGGVNGRGAYKIMQKSSVQKNKNILFDKLHEKKEKKEKHPNFELNVITTSVINTSTCEINTI